MALDWKDKVDGVDDVLAEDINIIARTVIKSETDIANIQKKVSELEENVDGENVDLSDYYTKSETTQLINDNTEVIMNFVNASIQSAIIDSWEAEV